MRRMWTWLAVVAVASASLAACLGGGTSATSAPTPGATPTRAPVSEVDSTYARTICRAFGRYLTALGDQTKADPSLFSDQARLLRVAAPILDTFEKDLEKAKPPKDVANFNKALIERVKVIAKQAKNGKVVTVQQLSTISKGAPLPPQTVRDRLAEASDAFPECQQSGGMDAVFGPAIQQPGN
jgi:hypothetical protein